MIEYSFGERKCKLDWSIFICLIADKKLYKSDFKDFSNLYEYIRYNDEKTDFYKLLGTKSTFFYIDGKLVCNKLDDRGCRNLEDFNNNEIFHYHELSNIKHNKNINTGKWYKRQEGVDYIRTVINIKQKILLDQRKKKLKQISNNE